MFLVAFKDYLRTLKLDFPRYFHSVGRSGSDSVIKVSHSVYNQTDTLKENGKYNYKNNFSERITK